MFGDVGYLFIQLQWSSSKADENDYAINNSWLRTNMYKLSRKIMH
jgi:hypothetical protein